MTSQATYLKLGDPFGCILKSLDISAYNKTDLSEPSQREIEAWEYCRAIFGRRKSREYLVRKGIAEAKITSLDALSKERAAGEGRVPEWQWRPGMVWIPLWFKVNGLSSIARLTVAEGDSTYDYPEVRRAIDNARFAVNRFLARGIKGFEPVPKDAWSVRIQSMTGREIRGRGLKGNSIALGVAVAMCSLAAGEVVPNDLVITGNIGEDGKLLGVDEIESKLAAAERMLPGFRTFVYPRDGALLEGCGRKIFSAPSLKGAIRKIFGPRSEAVESSVMNIQGTVDLLKSEYQRQRYSTVIQLGERIRPVLTAKSPDYSRCHWEILLRLAAAYGHGGKTKEANELFLRAEKIAGILRVKGQLGLADYLEAQNFTVSPLIDRFDIDTAESRLRSYLRKATPDLAGELRGRISGHLGDLLVGAGRHEKAIRYYMEAIKIIPEPEVGRNYCNLGHAYAGLQKWDLAEQAFQRCLDVTENDVDAAPKQRALAFLFGRWVSSRLEQGDFEGAQRYLDKAIRALVTAQNMDGKRGIGLWPGLLFLMEAYRGGLRISGKRVFLDRILQTGDSSGSPILKLLSRVSCLDAIDIWIKGMDNAGGRSLLELAEMFIRSTDEITNAKYWYQEELKNLMVGVRHPDRHKRLLTHTIRNIRRRMPNL